MKSKTASWIFTASCPSIIGTVDVVTRYMAQAGNYVDEIHSFDDRESGRFFIRIEFLPQDADFNETVFAEQFAERAAEFSMDWSLTAPNHKPKVAIMVSKYDHCLNDLLYRFRTGQLNIDVRVIIPNHPDLENLAKWHGIPYYHLPITPDTKPQQEAEILKLIDKYNADLVVLARYMQVLSPDMCNALDGKAINIHRIGIQVWSIICH